MRVTVLQETVWRLVEERGAFSELLLLLRSASASLNVLFADVLVSVNQGSVRAVDAYSIMRFLGTNAMGFLERSVKLVVSVVNARPESAGVESVFLTLMHPGISASHTLLRLLR